MRSPNPSPASDSTCRALRSSAPFDGHLIQLLDIRLEEQFLVRAQGDVGIDAAPLDNTVELTVTEDADRMRVSTSVNIDLSVSGAGSCSGRGPFYRH